MAAAALRAGLPPLIVAMAKSAAWPAIPVCTFFAFVERSGILLRSILSATWESVGVVAMARTFAASGVAVEPNRIPHEASRVAHEASRGAHEASRGAHEASRVAHE